MPPQTVAARTCRQTVLHRFAATLGPLDHMVHFPEAAVVLACPAASPKHELVPAEMAVASCLAKDILKLQLSHDVSA